MEYLGIVWLTSWLMEFVSSGEQLLTAEEYLENRSAGKVLLVADRSSQMADWLRKPRPKTTEPGDRRKPDPETVASGEFDRSWLEPFWHFLSSRPSNKAEFCRSPEQITAQTQLSSFLPLLVSPTDSAGSAQLISQKTERDPATNTMLKWMDEVLPFSIERSNSFANYPEVQVVRGNSQNSESESTPQYQLWVEGCLIGTMPHPISAYAIAFQLQHLFQNPDFDPRQIQAKMIDDNPAVRAGEQVLFVVDSKLAEQLDRHPKAIALEWIDNLRQALDIPSLTFAETQAQMYGLAESGQKLTGLASWYGPYFHGRLTANGEIYNQYDLTAAHRSLPFNTYLKVTNVHNGKSVIVRINDRGPYIPPRNLDLSLGAARQLGSEHTGVVEYKATIMKPETQGDRSVSQSVTKL